MVSPDQALSRSSPGSLLEIAAPNVDVLGNAPREGNVTLGLTMSVGIGHGQTHLVGLSDAESFVSEVIFAWREPNDSWAAENQDGKRLASARTFRQLRQRVHQLIAKAAAPELEEQRPVHRYLVFAHLPAKPIRRRHEDEMRQQFAAPRTPEEENERAQWRAVQRASVRRIFGDR